MTAVAEELHGMPAFVAGVVVARIASGELASGDRLPPHVALAGELNVSTRAIGQAFAALAGQGVIWRVSKFRYYVSASAPTAEPVTGEVYDPPELSPAQALQALRWYWRDTYRIWVERDTGLWLARRLDGRGVIDAGSPEKLRIKLAEDWLHNPAEVLL